MLVRSSLVALVTEAFEVRNGVKQGCVLAPAFFNIFFTCIMSHAVQELGKDMYIRYRLHGSLFDLCRITAKTNTLCDHMQESLFANDCALVAHANSDVELMVDLVSQ